MDVFDPLDLFTPEVNKNSYWDSDEEHQPFYEDQEAREDDEKRAESTYILNEKTSELQNSGEENEEDKEDQEEVVHVFDLPHVALRPPEYVLHLILKLFEPETQYNFSSATAHNITKSPTNDDSHDGDCDQQHKKLFTNKGVTEDELFLSLRWLKTHCPMKLQNLHAWHTVPQIRYLQPTEFFSYITSIVSSDLAWIQGATPRETNGKRDRLWKRASLRLAENCGRTAQPEFVRRIVFDAVRDGERFNVWLKEPSLTADNLGLKTWGSSLKLAERLILNYLHEKGSGEQKAYLRKPVLELGAGTGLVGIVCGILEKEGLLFEKNETSSVDESGVFEKFGLFLTDLPEITPNLQSNVDLNGLFETCHAANLDWTDSSSFDEELGIQGNTNVFNTVVLSDAVYSSLHPYLIVNMVKRYLNFENGGNVLLQIPVREKFEKERALLWRLIEEDEVLSTMTLVESLEEDGFDDFGRQRLIFKFWQA